MTMIRPTLIHIHIPKTAGTTLNFVLSVALRDHQEFLCALPEHAEELTAKTQVERDQIDFVFGHYPYGLHRLFTRPVRYMACLRESRQRIFSFYRFVLAKTDHPLNDIVRRSSHDFSSFLRLASEDPRIQGDVDNVQVRLLAGDMGLQVNYKDVLSLALSNIVAGNFLLGETECLDAFLARLERALQLKLGPIPRMNVSEDGMSFDEEMDRLAPYARDILEHFARWDTMLLSEAREVAENGDERISSPSHAVAASTGSAEMSPPVSEVVQVSELVRALYRALLLREPDLIGLSGYVEEIRYGRPIEDIMRRMLRSEEFGKKRAQFSHAYLSASPTGTFEFELVTHRCEGPTVTFALNKASKDTYTEGLRRALPPEHFIPFILRRARRKGGGLKVADFGANVGGGALPLAANGLNVLAIEALPANFMALATAARVNGLHNILPVNMAALDRAGLVSFSGTSARATAGIEGGDVTVPCDTLVNILQTYGFADVDVIKIDIGGAELPALSGAETFFADRPEAEVIFGSNNHTCHLFGYDRQDLLRWFVERGFSTYVFRADGLMPIRHDDPQPVSVVDILATRRSPSSLEQQGETIVPMTDDYVLQELLRISTSSNPHLRRHFITEAGRVGDSVKNSPLWSRIASAM